MGRLTPALQPGPRDSCLPVPLALCYCPRFAERKGPVFEALSDRLQGVFRKLTGQARLTPDNVRDSLREVRRALLEADVQVAVARDFVARVESRAVGQDVLASLTPGQQVVGIVREELESLLGKTPVTLAGSPGAGRPSIQ